MQKPADAQEAREAFAAVLRGRRSIDLFAPEPIGTEELLEAIDVARWAPNHRLTEPWRFYLVGRTTAAAMIELAAELDTAAKGEAAARSVGRGCKGFRGSSCSRVRVARIRSPTRRTTPRAVARRRI